MAGLRERKKHATRNAIHDGAHAPVRRARASPATTIDQIAEAADVSRATVFTYFPTKEDIVFGDAPQAIAALAERAARSARGDRPGRARLAPPAHGLDRAGPAAPAPARRSRSRPSAPAACSSSRQVERVVGDALERELGPDRARRAARGGALIAALGVAEDAAAARMERGRRARSSREEIDAILDAAIAFAEAGVAALPRRRGLGGAGPLPCRRRRRGGACTAPISCGLRKRLYSMIEIWIAAATGIASSAPSMPNSVEPNSTEVRTTNGCDLHGAGPGSAAG